MIHRSSHPRRAFTLTELLLVVTILAILIALLIPAFAAVREKSRRALCTSNMRQLSLVYRLYASEQTDYVPLGYSNTVAQYNYVVNVNDANNASGSGWQQFYVLQGVFYKGGYLTGNNDIRLSSGRAFFCPSNKNPGTLFDQRDTTPCFPESKMNPWPPIETKFYNGSQWLKCTTRVGYGVRPVVDWGDPSGSGNLPTPFPAVMPRLNLYAAKAILSDLVSTVRDPAECHVDGVNVMYGDFSVRWVPIDRFKTYLPPHDPAGFKNSQNSKMTNLYNTFDTQR